MKKKGWGDVGWGGAGSIESKIVKLHRNVSKSYFGGKNKKLAGLEDREKNFSPLKTSMTQSMNEEDDEEENKDIATSDINMQSEFSINTKNVQKSKDLRGVYINNYGV